MQKCDAGGLFGVTAGLQHLVYNTAAADLEISAGMALHSRLHFVQHDCVSGGKEQDLGLYYGVIILIATSA